jgi:hypothetical protein
MWGRKGKKGRVAFRKRKVLRFQELFGKTRRRHRTTKRSTSTRRRVRRKTTTTTTDTHTEGHRNTGTQAVRHRSFTGKLKHCPV